MKGRILDAVLAVALGAVFLAAAVPKLADPAGFALAIYRYHLLPDGVINLAAIYLPWIEAAAVAALCLPRHRRGAAALLAILLAVFTAAIALALARGLDVACGCFSTNPEAGRIGWLNLLRNAALLAAALRLATRPPLPYKAP